MDHVIKKLYSYRLKRKDQTFKEGLVVQNGDFFGEIAPLVGFSKETLEEAKKEALLWVYENKEPSLPSVCFGIQCAKRALKSIHTPLCALNAKKGFQTVKLKLKDLSLDQAIKLVKQYVGRLALRLDCNRAWSLEEACFFAKHFSPSDFLYLEEPVKTFEMLQEFSHRTKFPIAIDESIQEDWSLIPSLKAIVVKPTVVGYIPETPPHLDLILSSSHESGLGLLHIAHLKMNSLPIGLDTYDLFEEDLLVSPIETKNGFFSWQISNPLLDFSKLCAL